jgi:hypothetical protein
MSPDKSKELISIFPDIFSEPSSRSCMALYGFECGDGWFSLLKELISEIKAICVDNPGITVRVVQVKQKFGALRFYYDFMLEDGFGFEENANIDLEIDDAIERAENRSREECEECGKPSTITTNGHWLSNRCNQCCQTNDKQII